MAVKKSAKKASGKVAGLSEGPLEGTPPAGALNTAAVDAAVGLWVAIKNKRPTDYCNHSQVKIQADLDEMREGREDLKRFAACETPITVRHFDWFDLLGDAFDSLGDEAAETKGQSVNPRADKLMRRVVDARAAVARRAELSHVPTALFQVTRYDSASELLVQASRAARQARRQLGSFVGPNYSRKVVEELEASLQPLAAWVATKEGSTASSKQLTNRRRALKFLAYEAMSTVAPWGREVTAGDDSKAGRYALDQIFEGGSSKAATPSPAPQPAP